MIATPFPPPPSRVRYAFSCLQIVQSGDVNAIEQIPFGIDDLPRPWDPASCPSELRHAIWLWCDDVAEWINHEYGWRGTAMIPPCWPQHPYLAHELAGLCCERYLAGQATGPELLSDWHRHALPLFAERMTWRTGEACRTEHTDWPGAAAWFHYVQPDQLAQRQCRFYADLDPEPSETPTGR